MGFIKRTARFKIHSEAPVPEYVDQTFITTTEKLDSRLEEIDAEICKKYNADPDDVEMYELVVEELKTPRTDYDLRGVHNRWRR